MGQPGLVHNVVERLHSKTGAGQFGLESLDARWRPILTEALRIRAGDSGESSYADLDDRLRATRDFVAALVGRHEVGR